MLSLNAPIGPIVKWTSIISEQLVSFALLMFFVILSILEVYVPKRKISSARLRQSYRTNISLFLFNSIALSLLSVSSLLILAERFSAHGLLSRIPGPAWSMALAFLALDLMLYLWHRACHSVECLWMFHRVHHSDSDVNVSTAFRIHVLELIITSMLKAVYIITLGVDKTAVLVNEAGITLFVMFHHGNISLPGERQLGRIIVVPSIHRVHHSLQRAEHDRNYGAVFSIWDRLFGTFAELEPSATGIKNHPPLDFVNLLKFGFGLGSATVAPVAEPGFSLKTMVAEAAYYRAKQRGFSPGYELCDWLEAEKEINRQLQKDSAARSRLNQRRVSSLKLTDIKC